MLHSSRLRDEATEKEFYKIMQNWNYHQFSHMRANAEQFNSRRKLEGTEIGFEKSKLNSDLSSVFIYTRESTFSQTKKSYVRETGFS